MSYPDFYPAPTQAGFIGAAIPKKVIEMAEHFPNIAALK